MPAPGQDLYQRLEDMHHTAWTAKDGLIGRPTHLAQTSDGFLWIATTNGLYRFDGVAFERYQPGDEALPAAAVESLLAAKDGGLWVGYTRGGASFIAPDGRVVNYSVDDGLPIGVIRSIAQDHDGTVWVAATGGLARLEGGRWQMVRMDWNYPCRSAWRVFVDRDGTVWVGGASPNRVLSLPKGTRTFNDLDVDWSAAALAQLDDDTIVLADYVEAAIHEVRREADGWRPRGTIAALSGYGLALDGDGGLWIGGQGRDASAHCRRIVASRSWRRDSGGGADHRR